MKTITRLQAAQYPDYPNAMRDLLIIICLVLAAFRCGGPVFAAEQGTGNKAPAGKIKGSFDPNSYITREAIKEVKRTDWEKYDEGLERLITKHLDVQYRDGADDYFYNGLIKYDRKEILVLIEEKNKKNAEIIASAGHNETCDAPEIIFYKEGLRAAMLQARQYYNIAPDDFISFIFLHEIAHIKNEDNCSKRDLEEKEKAADQFALDKLKEKGASADTVTGLCQFFGRCVDLRRITTSPGIQFRIR